MDKEKEYIKYGWLHPNGELSYIYNNEIAPKMCFGDFGANDGGKVVKVIIKIAEDIK